jgi:membrane-associated phospholipid phosphatase
VAIRAVVLSVMVSCGVVAPVGAQAPWLTGEPQARSVESSPPWRSLLTELPADVWHLGTWDSAIIVGSGGLGALAVHTQEAAWTANLSKERFLEEFLDPGQYVGSSWVQSGGAFATYLLGRFTDHPRMATVGAELVRTQIVTEALTQGLKFSAGRTRPDGTAYSFPSGHASTAFATASVLQRELGWKVGAPAYAAATWVSMSRLSENRHYASDVVFGAALGIAAGRAVTVRRGGHVLVLGPLTGAGLRGIQASWSERQRPSSDGR